MRKTVICSIVLLLLSYCVSANADYTFDTPINLEPAVNSSVIDTTPSISSEGLSLFFSDRSGRYGSYDLWVTTRPTTDDEWGPAVNMGPTVNSAYREEYPSLTYSGFQVINCRV